MGFRRICLGFGLRLLLQLISLEDQTLMERGHAGLQRDALARSVGEATVDVALARLLPELPCQQLADDGVLLGGAVTISTALVFDVEEALGSLFRFGVADRRLAADGGAAVVHGFLFLSALPVLATR